MFGITTGCVGHGAKLVRKVCPNPELGARDEEWMRTLAAGNPSPRSMADARDLDIYSE